MSFLPSRCINSNLNQVVYDHQLPGAVAPETRDVLFDAMNITKQEVEKVARLARLELSDAEMERVTRQLDSILGYVAKLDELDTGSVVPTTHTQQLVNAFRDDEIKPSLPRGKALANAPRDNGESFVVPRIIS